ncbi:hypothetical protein DFQ27_009511 [Actinomortierella ambigua]|uniref:Large ribosomal subunit protein uL5m n=1 Tax=Actinomortierella ambigua TaxID=1343610 RepID=A0A9P6PQW8_9FUNG|nr:hypothetical protein DFQ27_009511 [Actinomortierella ambigua]
MGLRMVIRAGPTMGSGKRLCSALPALQPSLLDLTPIQPRRVSMQVRSISACATALQQKNPSGGGTPRTSGTTSVLKVPTAYTTGLSRLREHYATTLQEDIMIATYRHRHKPGTKYPPGVKIELKGHKHLVPSPKASSPTNVPELISIHVHCMMKEAITSKYNLLSGVMAIQSITGEMPEVIFAKKGVHSWKLRKGMPIGCRVQLKGDKMYQFLDKLVEVVLPRMKEWPGLPEGAGDGTGNIGMGFPPTALSLFPEIESNFDMFPRMTGFDITFNTTAYTNADARLLMSGFNMPFQKTRAAVRKEAAANAAATAAPTLT